MTDLVITGASGFVGQALLRVLSGKGKRGIAVSRQVPSSNIPSAMVWTHVDDYRDTAVTEDSTVVYLAESADAAAYGDAELRERQLATLCALLAKPVARFVYVSSAAVYGDEVATPRRTDELITPRSPYARYKRLAEERVLEAGGVVARPSNLYGQGMAVNNVVSDIIGQLKSGGPLRIQNRVPVRDFLWIEDYAEGLASLVVANVNGCFNFGTGIGTSVGRLAETILSVAGEGDRPVECSSSTARPSVQVLDVTATEATLGWRARTSLKHGLEKLIGNHE